jgi:hypothetical protein
VVSNGCMATVRPYVGTVENTVRGLLRITVRCSYSFRQHYYIITKLNCPQGVMYRFLMRALRGRRGQVLGTRIRTEKSAWKSSSEGRGRRFGKVSRLGGSESRTRQPEVRETCSITITSDRSKRSSRTARTPSRSEGGSHDAITQMRGRKEQKARLRSYQARTRRRTNKRTISARRAGPRPSPVPQSRRPHTSAIATLPTHGSLPYRVVVSEETATGGRR